MQDLHVILPFIQKAFKKLSVNQKEENCSTILGISFSDLGLHESLIYSL